LQGSKKLCGRRQENNRGKGLRKEGGGEHVHVHIEKGEMSGGEHWSERTRIKIENKKVKKGKSIHP